MAGMSSNPCFSIQETIKATIAVPLVRHMPDMPLYTLILMTLWVFPLFALLYSGDNVAPISFPLIVLLGNFLGLETAEHE